MPRGGYRPGAGRKPGTRNKTADAREVVERHAQALSGLVPADIAKMSPLEVMLHAMSLEASAANWRAAAALAEKAAPYVHPKLSAETLNVRTDDSSRSPEDLAAELAEIDAREADADQARALAPTMPNGNGGLVH